MTNTSRIQGHIDAGRYRNAIQDCDLAIASAPAGSWQKRLLLLKGQALLLAGELDEAKETYRQGSIKIIGVPSQHHNTTMQCNLGIDTVETVRHCVGLGEAALKRRDGGDPGVKGDWPDCAITWAERALTAAPNLESAQKLMLDALEDKQYWAEARRRCEAWAHNRDRCNGGTCNEAAYRSPRACIRAMHTSLRQGYCKALRNCGTVNEFKEAQDEAAKMGHAWGMGWRKSLGRKLQGGGSAAVTSMRDNAHALLALSEKNTEPGAERDICGCKLSQDDKFHRGEGRPFLVENEQKNALPGVLVKQERQLRTTQAVRRELRKMKEQDNLLAATIKDFEDKQRGDWTHFEDEKKRFEDEKKRFEDEQKRFETERGQWAIQIDRLQHELEGLRESVGPLVNLPESYRKALASVDGLETVLDDCSICTHPLLSGIGTPSFGLMSYSCGCSRLGFVRTIHVNCIFSMENLKCSVCREEIVMIAPSLMVSTLVRSIIIRKF